jgi:hypothetical protein
VSQEEGFSRFGPYLIVMTSGAGGMGRIELALRADGKASELCVLKRMHAGERAPEQEARFEREARIAARLSHGNIARTYRVEKVEGELCLAQEFVEGVNLARLAKQAGDGGIPAEAAVSIVREVAKGLTYAHDFGGLEIVHRDVTPENVMLSYAGDVKLIDFGISRSTVDGTVTNVGAIIGRRGYISPEGWAGARADRRADVYALGVVLWELLTGRRLEEIDEARWREGVPDPRTIKSEIQPELATVVLSAVASDPTKRFQSAAEFGDALAPFCGGGQGGSRSEIATLLAFYFNVNRARELLATEIDAARKSLEPIARPGKPQSSRFRGPAIAGGVAALVLLAGVAVPGLRGRSNGRAAQQGTMLRVDEAAPVSVATPASIPPARSALPAAVPAHVPDPTPPEASPRAGRRPVAVTALSIPTVQHGQVQDLLRRANEEWDDGRLASAAALAKKAISAGGGGEAHSLLGSIYMSNGQFEAAERELAEAARLNPHDKEAAKLLADARRARAEHGE